MEGAHRDRKVVEASGQHDLESMIFTEEDFEAGSKKIDPKARNKSGVAPEFSRFAFGGEGLFTEEGLVIGGVASTHVWVRSFTPNLKNLPTFLPNVTHLMLHVVRDNTKSQSFNARDLIWLTQLQSLEIIGECEILGNRLQGKVHHLEDLSALHLKSLILYNKELDPKAPKHDWPSVPRKAEEDEGRPWIERVSNLPGIKTCCLVLEHYPDRKKLDFLPSAALTGITVLHGTVEGPWELIWFSGNTSHTQKITPQQALILVGTDKDN